MKDPFLVITSIAGDDHPVLQTLARGAMEHGVRFILIGDTKSPPAFRLEGCEYYPVERQGEIDDSFSKHIPVRHYSRKNLGYLAAMQGRCRGDH